MPSNMAAFSGSNRFGVGAGEADIYLKIILLGDAGTGKTSLMQKYTHAQSADGAAAGDVKLQFEHSPDTSNKLIHRNDKTVMLEIRDTAGMERYRSLTKSHYNGALGALILFDLTDEKSFTNVVHWLEDLKEYSDHPDRIQVLLVGTRSHDKDRRKVSADKIFKMSEHHDAASIEISIKENINVTEAFELLVDHILESNPEFNRSGQPLFLPVSPSRGAGGRDEDIVVSCGQCCPIGSKPKEFDEG